MKTFKKTVFAYLHTHWDVEWYRTQEEFNVRLVEVFDKVLYELKKNKTPSFYFDGQVLALLNYLKFRPEKKPLIKKLIKQKKLFIGPFFVSADNLLVSGTGLIKNLELGLKISKEFGEDEFIGYLSDTFGHSSSIFEILKFFKIENAIVWRGTPKLPADFLMNGLKTSRLVQGYYQDILHSKLPIDKKAQEIEKILDKINEFSNDALLLPLGGDHLAPVENSSETIKEINKYLEKYEIKLSNPFEYLKKADFTKEKYEGELLDNSLTYILQGVYSSRTDEKAKNAFLQYELFNKTEVFDFFLNNKYNSELKIAELNLIKNQAHDSIYGCSKDSVHKMVRTRQIKTEEIIKAVNLNLVRDFKKKYLKTLESDKIGVLNFSNHPYKGIIKFISDKKLKNAQMIKKFNSVSNEIMSGINSNPMSEDFHTFYEYLYETENLEAFSFKNIKLSPIEKRHTLNNDFIENDFLKLFIFENKISVIDKKTGKIYENFIELHSTKDGGDSYNYAPLGYPDVLKIKKTKVNYEGNIKSSLQVIFEENIKLNFSLGNLSELFEIEAHFVNKKKNRKLQIVFNLDSKIKSTISENPIGTIKRTHNPDYLLFENMPCTPKIELKTNAYPMQRFVFANGVSFFTKGLNEYEIYKNSLKIALLRSTGLISNPKNKARWVPAGPPVECPDLQGLFEHRFNLAFSFSNEETLFQKADEFYSPTETIFGEFKIKEKTFIKNFPENSVFYGILDENGKKIPLFYKGDFIRVSL